MQAKKSSGLSSKKLLKKGGEGDIDNICIQETINCNNYMQILDEDNLPLGTEDIAEDSIDLNLYTKILKILKRGAGNEKNINNITKLLETLNTNRNVDTGLKIYHEGKYTDETVPSKLLDRFKTNGEQYTIFDDIAVIVKNMFIEPLKSGDGEAEEKTYEAEINHHFQTAKFKNIKAPGDDQWKYNTLWGKYQLSRFETKQIFITIDPTIIQLLIFDNNYKNYHIDVIKGGQDIVYSLKLIIRPGGYLQLRYTTHLFPILYNNEYSSYIQDFDNLKGFDAFNVSLGNIKINQDYAIKRKEFLNQYIKFYKFYKKCYTINDKNLIDYQLKYISILGKARFGNPDVKKRTAVLTDYVMGNLIFANPTYGFISGGYKGFKSDKFGITRSGYEIAKKYNRPVLTIMCQEGTHDAHEFSDATLIYGEHWGEDTIALSQLTDGAIVIAPFGGWTYVECLALLAKKRIVGIYNDFFNILNYEAKSINSHSTEELNSEKMVSPTFKDADIVKIIDKKKDDKDNNKNFFKFLPTEQKSIIDYYINYYFILLYLLKTKGEKPVSPGKSSDSPPDDLPPDDLHPDLQELYNCLKYEIQILTYLKTYFENDAKLYKIKDVFSDAFIKLIEAFNKLKTTIDTHVNIHLTTINTYYGKMCKSDPYQNEIPINCDGIWTKPLFDLTTLCIAPDSEAIKVGGNKRLRKRGGECTISNDSIHNEIMKCNIDINKLLGDNIFKNLNNNIIFVFSDVMYLNMYLNKNLNASHFQLELHKKINQLTSTRNFIKNQSFKTMRQLLPEYKSKYLTLNRHMDGMFTEEGKLITENILRENYSSIIDDTCNNYTLLLEDTSIVESPNNGEIPDLTTAKSNYKLIRTKPQRNLLMESE